MIQIRKFVKIPLFRLAALLLALLALLSIPVLNQALWPNAAAVGDPVPYLRVGLRYDTNAPESVDLQNYQGSGYDFGYFDENRRFVPLFGTKETAVSVMKDHTMYRNASHKQYESGTDGSITVGCWHILMGVCGSLGDAQALADAQSDGFVAWSQDGWRACAGSFTSEASAEAALRERGISGTVMTGSDRCVTVAERDTGRILFEFDDTGRSLGVMPRASASGEAATWFSAQLYRGGFQFSRRGGGNLTVVNFVSMDNYTAGVIPYEMSSGWPMEALKAQAVAAKTYAAAYLNRHDSQGFDLCAGTHCQCYKGVKLNAADCEQAVRETSGVYVTYEGQYIKAFYSSCDGGATENSENVFVQKLDYLRGKKDIYEGFVHTGWESWSYVYTAAEITELLNNKGYHCSTIVGITPQYTATGNIASLTFTDANGRKFTFTGQSAGSILVSKNKSTHSQRFTVTSAENPQSVDFRINSTGTRLDTSATVYVMGGDGQIQALDLSGGVSVMTDAGVVSAGAAQDLGGVMIRGTRFLIRGSGSGHNVGMSQYGAKAMAELGHTYEEILSFYYTGVTIG